MIIPFPTGVPVRGRDFIGREKEVREIIELAQGHQSVILTAPRKYGKTSILLEVLDRLKERGFLTGRVDIFQTSSRRELAEAITEEVLKNRNAPFKNTIKAVKTSLTEALKRIEIKQVVKDFEFVLSFADSKVDEDYLLDTALDFPQEFAKKRKKHLVFAFDEFGDLSKMNGGSLIKKMRAKFQLQEDVTYLFTGSQESIMEQLFASRSQAFFRFGRILPVGELPEGALRKYVLETFRRLGFSITEEVVNKIVSKTNAHPYYSQLLSQLIYFSLKGEKKCIKEKDVEDNFIRAIFAEKSYFDQLWSELMESRHLLTVLKAIVLEEKSPYKIEQLSTHNLYRSLLVLENKGLVKKISRGKYIVRDPLLKGYIRMRETGAV